MRFDDEPERRCGFCGHSRFEVRKLITGRGVFICDRCIGMCKQALVDAAGREEKQAPKKTKRQTPKEIALELDKYVVGQIRAKRVLAVAVYNHRKRILAKTDDGVELSKGNILLIGPSGTGKTHLARTLARILDVPFAMADATPLTQAGYVGEDVESILVKLFRAAKGDVARAERGVIYLDEVDKLVKKQGHYRDVGGEGVQQGLLKILEGTKATIKVGGDPNGMGGEQVVMDTSHILFIAGGAFDGLARQMSESRGTREMGFRTEEKAEAQKVFAVTPSDLHKFGFLPEFVGRFPVFAVLDALDEAALVKILTEPKDAVLRQFQRLFAMSGAKLEATPDGLSAMAAKSFSRKTGARGLRSVLENLLLETMFDLAVGAEYVIDADAVAANRPRRLEDVAAVAEAR